MRRGAEMLAVIVELFRLRKLLQSAFDGELFQARQRLSSVVKAASVNLDEARDSMAGMTPCSRREFIPDALDSSPDVANVVVFTFEPQVAVPALPGVEPLHDRAHESKMTRVQAGTLHAKLPADSFRLVGCGC